MDKIKIDIIIDETEQSKKKDLDNYIYVIL